MRFIFFLLLAFPLAAAAQYKSEARIVDPSELNRPPPKVEDVADNPEPILKSLADNPYQKSLVLQQLAAHAIEKEDGKKAIKYYEEIIRMKSLTGSALQPIRLTLAKLYYQAKRYKDTIRTLRVYFSRGGAAKADVWVLQASAYIKQNKHRLAKKPLESAIQTLEGGKDIAKREDWFKLLLAVYYKRNEHKAAAALLKRMVRHFPKNTDYWMQLSALYIKAKKKHEALAVVEMAHRVGVLEEEQQYVRFARLFMNAGAPYYGATLLSEWLQDGTVKESAAYWELVTQAWIDAREDAKAIESLQTVIAIKPSGARYLQLGQLYVQRRQWEPAVRALTAAVNRGGLKGNTGAAWVNLALAQYERKNIAGARESFQRARKYKSVRKSAKQWLEYLDSVDEFGLVASKVAAKADSQRGQQGSAANKDLSGVFNRNEALFDAPIFTGEVTNSSDAGAELTPVGAIKKGNADGSIPSWEGGYDQASIGDHYAGDGSLKDIFVEDQPLAKITAVNMPEFENFLSEGHKKLLLQHGSYYLNLYPSRRSARYPQAVYEASIKNEGLAKLVGSDSLRDAKLGVPFRNPDTGAQVLWNHRVRYRGDNVHFKQRHMVVDKDGVQRNFATTTRVLFAYGNLDNPGLAGKANMLLYFVGLGSNYGQKGLALAHDTIDLMDGARKIWVKSPTGNNLIRVPPVGYDFPNPSSDGISYIDQIDMYNGAFDRYDWRIVGKRDMIIPYNAYRLNRKSLPYSGFVKAEHPEQAAMRYEKHRVWVVEATKRKGAAHHFRKRVFYVDEDSWSVVMVDNYSATNQLWKFQEGHPVPLHDIEAVVIAPQFIYDLVANRYYVTGLSNEEPKAKYNQNGIRAANFTPSAARRLLR